MIGWPQENQSAAFALDGSPDTDELTETEAVHIGDIRQIQYELEMTFLQQLLEVFTQSHIKETQSAGNIDDDDTRNDS